MSSIILELRFLEHFVRIDLISSLIFVLFAFVGSAIHIISMIAVTCSNSISVYDFVSCFLFLLPGFIVAAVL